MNNYGNVYGIFEENEMVSDNYYQQDYMTWNPYLHYVPQMFNQSDTVHVSNLHIKKKHKDSKCYTCKPRGKVKKHIITEIKDWTFHHDMHKRPLIVITPKRHVKSFHSLTDEEVLNYRTALKKFIDSWNITDYKVTFHEGNWQNHTHFNIHVKITEKIINRMRRDHFENIKLNERYTVS